MCSTVCYDRILQEVEHVTIDHVTMGLYSIREAGTTIVFVIIIIHVIFSFSLKTFSFLLVLKDIVFIFLLFSF